MAILTNGLETIELGATAWRVIHNANITKLDECLYRIRTDSGDTTSAYLNTKVANSLSVDTSAHKLQLSGDVASPGANYGYGTNRSGVRGWVNNTRPSFRVSKGGTNQDGVVASSGVLLTMGTEDWDTNYNYAANAFTPTVSGDYLFTGAVVVSGMSAGARGRLELWKNAVLELAGKWVKAYSADDGLGCDFAAPANANGTTDYFELRFQHESTKDITVFGTATVTWFAGVRVR